MNRKSHKSSLTKAKKGKVNSQQQANKNRKPFGSDRTVGKNKSAKLKPKSRQTRAIVKDNSRLKQGSTAPKNSAKSRSMKKVIHERGKKPKSVWLAVYIITIAVGLSTILGTLVSIVSSWDTPQQNPVPARVSTSPQTRIKLDNLFAISSLGKEIVPLKSELQQLIDLYGDLEPEIFLVDLDTKGFVSIKGQEVIASASTIKLPILVAFFQDVDSGKIDLGEQLTMTPDAIAEGSGSMQYEKPGTKFSALETADKMMTTSDNTATNMLIERLGGMEQLNQRFTKMGLKATRLRNPLPDLAGTNSTTPEDLGNLLAKIDSGDLISLRSRDRLLHIMRNLVRNTLLPEGLEPGAIIAHKTGDIKSVLGDVGIIDMPNGKRYIASILVKRPDNSPQAKEFIQKASGIAYQYFKNSRTASFSSDSDRSQ